MRSLEIIGGFEMSDLPEWSDKALAMLNGESIVFIDKRSQVAISRDLQRLRHLPEEKDRERFKLRSTAKPGLWVLCRKDWPHKFFAKRAPNKSGVSPLSNLKKESGDNED